MRFLRNVPLMVVVCGLSVGSSRAADQVVRVTRAYDVRFLSEPVPDFPAEEWTRFDAVPDAVGVPEPDAYSHQEDVGGASISFTSAVEAPPGTRISPEAIIGLITANIAEDSWSNRKNSIEARDAQLVVVQTPEVQQEIATLLASLRAQRARMVVVDVALVPPDALGADAGEATLTSERLEAVLAAAGAAGRRMSLTAYNDQTVSAFRGRRRTVHADDHVNVTGVIPVVEPAVTTLPLGVAVEVRPHVLEGLDLVALDLSVRRLETDGEAEKRATFFTDLELQPLRRERLETSLLLEPGRVVVTGIFSMRGAVDTTRSFAVLARATPLDVQAEPAPRPVPTTHHLRVHDLGFLIAPFDEHELDGDTIVELVRLNVDPEAWLDRRADLRLDGAFLLATALTATHEKIAAWIAERVRRRGRLATIEVREIQGPVDAIFELEESAVDGYLPEDWKSSAAAGRLEETFAATARGVGGTRLSAAAQRAQPYLGDVEHISGGAANAVVIAPDPVVSTIASGFVLRALAAGTLRDDRVALDLELDRARFSIDRHAKALVGTRLAPTIVGADSGKVSWLSHALDLPAWRRRSIPVRAVVLSRRDRIADVRTLPGGAAVMVIARAGLEAPASARPRGRSEGKEEK